MEIAVTKMKERWRLWYPTEQTPTFPLSFANFIESLRGSTVWYSLLWGFKIDKSGIQTHPVIQSLETLWDRVGAQNVSTSLISTIPKKLQTTLALLSLLNSNDLNIPYRWIRMFFTNRELMEQQMEQHNTTHLNDGGSFIWSYV
jgi:hypothetical protein